MKNYLQFEWAGLSETSNKIWIMVWNEKRSLALLTQMVTKPYQRNNFLLKFAKYAFSFLLCSRHEISNFLTVSPSSRRTSMKSSFSVFLVFRWSIFGFYMYWHYNIVEVLSKLTLKREVYKCRQWDIAAWSRNFSATWLQFTKANLELYQTSKMDSFTKTVND